MNKCYNTNCSYLTITYGCNDWKCKNISDCIDAELAPMENEKQESKNTIQPHHYKRAKNNNDVINFCQDNDLSFDQGNIIKYVTRYKHKNGLNDLYKAREYLTRLIELEEKENGMVPATKEPNG